MQKLVKGKRFSTEEARGFLTSGGDVVLLFPRNSYPYSTGIINLDVSRISREQGFSVIPIPLKVPSLQGYSLDDINALYDQEFVEEVVI